jgi:hypothetical protein
MYSYIHVYKVCIVLLVHVFIYTCTVLLVCHLWMMTFNTGAFMNSVCVYECIYTYTYIYVDEYDCINLYINKYVHILTHEYTFILNIDHNHRAKQQIPNKNVLMVIG